MSKKRFILTTQNKNSYGFAVLAAGIDMSRFIENPVMLSNHDLDKPIGTWADIKLEANNTWTAVPVFDADEYSQEKAKKVESGSLRGASVWIEPLEVQLNVAGFPADLPVVTKSICMEASITPVPSDASALQLCSSDRKLLTGDNLQRILLSVNNTNQIEEGMKKLSFFIAALAPAGITLKADASEDDLLALVTKLSADKAAVDLEKTQLETKLAAIETANATAKTARIEGKVQAAITAGKLKATATETIDVVKGRWAKLMAQDEDSATAILDGMTAHKPLNEQLETGANKDLKLDALKGKTFNQLFQEFPTQLKALKTAEPEVYARLAANPTSEQY